MVRGILGRKLNMTQAFDDSGRAVALTIVQAGPCWVTQLRTPERDGYTAAQIGFESSAGRHLARNSPADAFVDKPFDIGEIEDLVRRWLE